MFDEVRKYKNNGHFFLRRGGLLAEESKDVPELPGVYFIMRLARGHVELVYIGKSGTIKQDMTFKNQLLKSSINGKQEGIKSQDFFDNKMTRENIDALDIYWFVTMDKSNNDLPGYVEGLLMQRFYELYGRLPEWNKEF
jgi:hypothetical protein